jgi:YHS domain-containing protein/copper chaperone CopZ
MNTNKIAKDPVCHMDVSDTSLKIEYAGIHYGFCSEQCKDRFLANPHLYIGVPGHKAPAQKGMQLIKRRRMLLETSLDSEQVTHVRQALFEMMGIQEVAIENDTIDIQYDLLQVTAEQIADKLELIGTQLGGGLMDRLKLAFIDFQEEAEISRLEVEDNQHSH